jgi:2-keto-4-pentenoate hydratase/2-oxohepta-3-ene-1,7-dioic acid hydratase in catechol pathway
MKIVRFTWQNEIAYGLAEGDQLYAVEGSVFEAPRRGEWIGPLAEVRLLAPCAPTKIVAVGLNYADHAAETDNPIPAEPLIFFKPPSAVIGPGQAIVCPPASRRVDYEAELAVVIGRRAKDVPPERAADAVLGYTCGNDVTARDLQGRDRLWTRAKGFDTFCPLGPWIVTGLNPADLAVECRVNGQTRQRSSTRHLIFAVPELIAFISGIMTLEPGDVILTGTPAGIDPLRPGDRVEVEVEGVGVLENPVVAPPSGRV